MIDLLLSTAKWWLVVSLLGAGALPFARRIFAALPDRGLAFTRPLGILAAGLIYWFGAMAGVLPNSLLGAALAALAVIGGGLWLARKDGLEWRGWWRENRSLVLGYELIFALAFLGWALYRGFNPNIETSGGEKYMEMALISGILESPGFPPLDPWLSGGTISYYYFGYVIAALLTRLSFVPRFEAFNLLVPMTLGLTLVAACGIGWNLAALAGAVRQTGRWATGLATGLLLALMGSLEGFLELAYIRAWLPARFFDWIAIKNLGVATEVCGEPGSGYGAGGWVPGRFIWWWRGSRVITDVDPLTGGCREVIHEFPFFSFMLADAHPHVMTLPYALLVMALALSVLAGGFDLLRERDLWSPRYLALPLLLGALGFLNTWDLPTYGFVLVCAWALRTLARSAAEIHFDDARSNLAILALGALGAAALAWRLSALLLEIFRGLPPEAQPAGMRWTLSFFLIAASGLFVQALWSGWRRGHVGSGRLLDALRFAVWLGALSIIFYLPFYLGFSSQASGFGLVDIRSRLPQWLVHFGPLFWLALCLVGLASLRLARPSRGPRVSRPSQLILTLFAGVAIYALLLGAWTALTLALVCGLAAALATETWSAATREARLGDADFRGSRLEAGDAEGDEAPAEAPRHISGAAGISIAEAGPSVAVTFALLCVAVGLLMPLGTEFVFVRDLFGSRMNSIFKLYYQAWTLLALGGGFALFALWRGLPRPAGLAWALPTTLLIAGGMVFTLAAPYTRTNGFSAPEGLSLDGLRWWRASYPGDLEAAAWIEENVDRGRVILEAHTPGNYAHNGRISLASGRPDVLGWAGHQHQWRGNDALGMLGERQADIEALYGSAGEAQARELLDRYDIAYVVVGTTERAMGYFDPASEERFARMMTRVFSSSDGQTHIYARRAANP